MKTLKPTIFNNFKELEAGFTLSNRDEISEGEAVPGTDFGSNTKSSPEKVNANFDRLFSDSRQIALAHQVHGNKIQIVTEGGIYDDTDGFVTNKKDLMLGIRVADCAALLLYEPDNSVISALHAGWRGALSGIVSVGIEKMIGAGAEPRKIKAFISPCISVAKFEVGDEVAIQFPDEFVNRSDFTKPHIDLKGFLRNELLNARLDKNNIELDTGCTMTDPKFYSYRRERENAGRMLGYIKMNL